MWGTIVAQHLVSKPKKGKAKNSRIKPVPIEVPCPNVLTVPPSNIDLSGRFCQPGHDSQIELWLWCTVSRKGQN
jgi:hypothetical protein